MKKWIINRPDEKKAEEIASRCDVDKLAASIMVSRGYDSVEAIADFFSGEGLEDPFACIDMKKAADTIMEAVDAYELICIYGDYDCDGVTSTAILYDYLLSIGANVTYYIPERADGYGMNMNAIKYLYDKGVKLIITVDNGIAAIDEAEEIYRLGMKLVVTDHHQVGERLPRAEAVVDPHRADCPSKFKELCGCGVALKLCAALDEGNYESVLDQYLDICALATIADVVSLTGENRYIVRQGLRLFDNTDNFGLRALKEKAGCKEVSTSTDVSFTITPRINAAGRFGSPITAVKLLLSDAEDAEVYAGMLMSHNDKRKEVEAVISRETFEYINQHPEALNERVLVISGKGWAHGVVGIVAARVMEYYGKPTVLLSEEGGELRGSARSIKGFNIFDCFQSAKDILVKCGGHECAGGLTVLPENLGELKRRIYSYAGGLDMMPVITLKADKILYPDDIDVERVKGLSRLEPFGEGNPLPVFAIIGGLVNSVKSLSNGRHSKIEINYGGKRVEILLFNNPPEKLTVSAGKRADFLVTLEINEYGGRESVSLKAVDYRPSGFNQSAYFSAKDAYERFKRGEKLPESFMRKITPTRNELAAVYKAVKAARSTDIDRLYYCFDASVMNYCKLRLCVDILTELGLFSFKAGTGAVTLLPSSGKVDLESSELYKQLIINN